MAFFTHEQFQHNTIHLAVDVDGAHCYVATGQYLQCSKHSTQVTFCFWRSDGGIPYLAHSFSTLSPSLSIPFSFSMCKEKKTLMGPCQIYNCTASSTELPQKCCAIKRHFKARQLLVVSNNGCTATRASNFYRPILSASVGSNQPTDHARYVHLRPSNGPRQQRQKPDPKKHVPAA